MKSLLFFCLVLLVLFPAVSSFGSGYLNPDIGAASLGMGVSVVAKADDLTAVYFNPAGLIQLKKNHFLVSPRYIMVDSEYEHSPSGESATSDEPSWVGFSGFSTDLNRSDMVFAIGIYAPFGLKLVWPDTGPQRYTVTSIDFKTLYLTPSLAYSVTDKFSVGLGISMIWADAQLKKKSSFHSQYSQIPAEPPYDVDVEINGDDFTIGGDLGVQYKFSDNLTWGFMYISEVNLSLDGETNMEIPVTVAQMMGLESHYSDNGNLDITLPQQARTGIFWKPMDKLGVEFDFNWINWASNEDLFFDFDNQTPLTQQDTNIKRNWDNSITIRLGAEYNWNENILLRAGYIFDQSPIPDETLDPIVPDADKNIFCLGAGYRLNNMTLDISCAYLAYEDRNISNSEHEIPTNGLYKSSIQMVAFSFGYTF